MDIILISPSAPQGQSFDEESAKRLVETPNNGGWKYKDTTLQAAHEARVAKAEAEAIKASEAARKAEQTQKDAANANRDTGIPKESIEETDNSKGGPASGKT